MKTGLKLSLISVLLCLSPDMGQAQQLFSDNAEMDNFISELMSKMTLDEKIGQLNLLPNSEDIITGDVTEGNIKAAIAAGQIGGTFNVKGADKVLELQKIAVEKSRLGIPLLVGMDVIHGFETVFPIPLALSCSWDMDAIEQMARISAIEASAAGVNWTFSPMVDIARDPRWGRVAEGAGEDPFLGSEIARAMVRGYQGNLGREDEILACVKHFALYGAAEGGRDYNTVDMSRYRMYNDYFPPYKAAVEEGAASVMTSFNVVDGIPATANRWLINDVLRDQWGFNGFVVTDYGSIAEMEQHGVGKLEEASARALNAGTDMDMCSLGFIGTLKQNLESGRISIDDIDKAVRRILEAKYRLGLFKNPYKYNNPEKEKTLIYTDRHRAKAREIATETFVLIKNENNILPLPKKGKIALIGPLADARSNMPGTWSVAADCSKYKSLYEGFCDALKGKAEVEYAKGSNIEEDAQLEQSATIFGHEIRDPRSSRELLDQALQIAQNADVIVAAVGESSEYSGESSSRSRLKLPETQKQLLTALLSTGKPVVMLNFSGRPTVMDWELENIPAILNVWFAGSEAADAIADVVFGDVNPSGKLTMSFPYNEGQIPVYYNHLNTGRPKDAGQDGFQKFRSNYFEIPNEPLLPFGYGLSYTSYEYGEPVVDRDSMTRDDKINISIDVTNTGNRAGDEIIQLYIRDLIASVSRPVKELKGFKRISLEPGQTKNVKFEISAEDLEFYDYNLDKIAEPGEFEIMIGPDSQQTKSKIITLL